MRQAARQAVAQLVDRGMHRLQFGPFGRPEAGTGPGRIMAGQALAQALQRQQFMRDLRAEHQVGQQPDPERRQAGVEGHRQPRFVALGAGLRDVDHAALMGQRHAQHAPVGRVRKPRRRRDVQGLGGCARRAQQHAAVGADHLPGKPLLGQAADLALHRQTRWQGIGMAGQQRAHHLGRGTQGVVEQFVDLVLDRQQHRQRAGQHPDQRPADHHAAEPPVDRGEPRHACWPMR